MQTVRLRPEVVAPCAGGRPESLQAEILTFPAAGGRGRPVDDAAWMDEVETGHWFFARAISASEG